MVLRLFRLAIKTDLGSRVVRAWSIMPAAVNERDMASDLLEAGLPRDLLLDKGFTGKAFAAGQAARGTAVLLPLLTRTAAIIAAHTLMRACLAGA